MIAEWRTWWRQTSTQAAIAAALFQGLSWLTANYQQLEQYVSPSTFQLLSFVCVVLVPVLRQIRQTSVTEARNNAQHDRKSD